MMSDKRPIGSNRALMVREKPITTHWTLGRSILRSDAVEGRATMTLPWSITDAKRPMARAKNTQYLYLLLF